VACIPAKITRKRRKLRIGIIFLLVITAIAALWLMPGEPSYHGKTVTYWLRTLKVGWPNFNEESLTAFRAMGAPGVRFLVNRIEDHEDGRFRMLIMHALERSDLRVAQTLVSKLAYDSIMRPIDRVEAYDAPRYGTGWQASASTLPQVMSWCQSRATSGQERQQANRRFRT
jgi:hypothetical protein